MATADLAQAIEENHRALDAFLRGDAEPLKALYSQRDDATIANPFGPPARGWTRVAPTLEHAASYYRDGYATGFERISEYAALDLAYTVEIERYRSKVAGSAEAAPVVVRVTTIFRLEEDGWKIVHRHADPITSSRTPDSVLAH